MKNKNLPRLILIVIAVLVLCTICSITSIVLWPKVSNIFGVQYDPWPAFTPQFNDNSNYELLLAGEKNYLFIKGKVPLDASFGVAQTINNRPELVGIKPLQTFSRQTRGYLSWEYQVLEFTPFNPDCFAIYENGEYIDNLYIFHSRPTLPSPSDKWMCEGFDFHNGKQYLKY